MKKMMALLVAALMLLCTACSAAPAAPASIEDVTWKYKDLEDVKVAVSGEALEDLLWGFGLDSLPEDGSTEALQQAMKDDAFFSTTFVNQWLILHKDGTAEYSRNGEEKTLVWQYEGSSKETGYLAETEEDLQNEEARMQFTVSKDGKEIRLESREPYDGEYQYTLTFVLQPEK